MNNTLQTGLLVLQALATRERPVGVAELARSIAKDKSNVHRVLATLTQHGFVTQDSNSRKYQVATRWSRPLLGAAPRPSSSLVGAGLPNAVWWPQSHSTFPAQGGH